jgi:predicted nucleic acid-binding protein
MTKKIFIDSDVILDLLAKREVFYDDAAQIFTLAYDKRIVLCTTPVVLTNVFYILRKIRGSEESKRQIKNLRLMVHILPINGNIVDMALNSKFSDFEDGLQYFTAKEHNIWAIITRNTKDYKARDIIIQTSKDFIKTSQSFI